MSEGLRVEIHGNVGVVIMNRPPHNFLNFRQIHDIADALEELQSNMSIGCAVLAADGKSFCAGADFAGDGVGGGDEGGRGGGLTYDVEIQAEQRGATRGSDDGRA